MCGVDVRGGYAGWMCRVDVGGGCVILGKRCLWMSGNNDCIEIPFLVLV